MHTGDGHPTAVDHDFLEGFETIRPVLRQSGEGGLQCIRVNPSAAAAVSDRVRMSLFPDPNSAAIVPLDRDWQVERLRLSDLADDDPRRPHPQAPP